MGTNGRLLVVAVAVVWAGAEKTKMQERNRSALNRMEQRRHAEQNIQNTSTDKIGTRAIDIGAVREDADKADAFLAIQPNTARIHAGRVLHMQYSQVDSFPAEECCAEHPKIVGNATCLVREYCSITEFL